MTVEIPLTRGLVALVDDADAERVISAGKWQAIPCGMVFYARRSFGPRGATKNVGLHRFILDLPDDIEIDHINHEPLDNRRANLRPCTRAQNCANARYRTSTGYRGVYFCIVGGHVGHYPKSIEDAANGYYAGIRSNGKFKRLGRFADPLEAARAYDAAAIQVWGEFATLNFPQREVS